MRSARTLLILGKALLLLTGEVAGQSFSAVSIGVATNAPGEYSPNVVGYAPVGVGWMFMPNEDLIVTELGKLGGVPRALYGRVQIWDTTGNAIVGTTNFTSSLDDSGIVYGSISPVLLAAGIPYIIDFTGDGQTVVVQTYFQDSTEPALRFQIAPQLTAFSSGTLQSAGHFNPSSIATDVLYLGPTFKFTTVPEPSSIAMILLGVVIVRWKFRTAANRG